MQILTTEGSFHFPADFPRWLMLFYYSGDFLPVSATELMALAQLKHTFKKKQCDLLCISADRIASHLAFIKTLNRYRLAEYPAPVTFPLGEDPEGVLRRAWNLSPNQKYLWLFAPGGVPKAQFTYPAEVGANFTEALRTLSALQLGRPTPCGWVPEAYPLALPPQTRAESDCFMAETEREGGIAIDWYISLTPPY